MSDPSEPAAAGPASPKIVIERTYRAKLRDLWDLWTTREGFESWWGPEGFRVEVRTLEARVGGRLEYSMIATATEVIAAMKRMGRPTSQEAHARFGEMRAQERLTLISVIDFVPGVKPYESTIAVDFVSLGKSSRMVVTIDPMHSEEFTRMTQAGFTSQLSKLDGRFGREKA